MQWSILALILRIAIDIDQAMPLMSHSRISLWETKAMGKKTTYPLNLLLKKNPKRPSKQRIYLCQENNYDSISNKAERKDITSLRDLGKECDRRTKLSPYETQDDKNVFKGDGSKGYNVIKASDLLIKTDNIDVDENKLAMMHIMDALVAHSFIVVDITNDGTNFDDALTLLKMWHTSEKFFETIRTNSGVQDILPGMKVVDDTGSPHHVTGFACYGGGEMKFLETRIVRDAGHRTLVPGEFLSIIGNNGMANMIDSFDVMCEVGKDVVEIAVAATNMEYGAFMEESRINKFSSHSHTLDDNEFRKLVCIDEESNNIEAAKISFEAAALLAKEVIDDGKILDGYLNQAKTNTSPHRICRYEAIGYKTKPGLSNSKEIFGAHTDTSFMTLVPVAAISGLEIFDESSNKWLRPELLARQAWEDDRRKKGLNIEAQFDRVTVFGGEKEHDVDLPWFCRYIVAMPGELLQIVTRNKVAASVHRVVGSKVGEARMSAPALLRPRSGVKMNSSKYFGRNYTSNPLLKECDGMKMEDVHAALQPSSYRS